MDLQSINHNDAESNKFFLRFAAISGYSENEIYNTNLLEISISPRANTTETKYFHHNQLRRVLLRCS